MERLFGFDEMVSCAAKIQKELATRGINNLVGGGVGADLLAIKYSGQFSPRSHKDLDFYIRDKDKRKLGILKPISRSRISPFQAFFSRYHIITNYTEIPVDIFLIVNDNQGQPVVAEVLAVETIYPIYNRRFTKIDLQAEIVTHNGQTINVLRHAISFNTPINYNK